MQHWYNEIQIGMHPNMVSCYVEGIEACEVDGEKVGVVRGFVFLGAKIEDSVLVKVTF